MTVQGNEQQPIPVGQVDPATPAAATPPPPDPTDPDEIELRDAMAAAEAEKTAPAPSKPDPASGTPVAAAPVAPKPADRAPIMVPKARLDEVLTKLAEAQQDAAYQRGLAEARAGTAGGPAAPGQPPAPVQVTPEQRLASIRTEIDALAKKFDDGEITMAEFKKQERGLTDQELAIREEARVKPAASAQVGGDELYLETLTAKLETEHPWVAVADQVGGDADWAYVKQRAIDNLVERGVDPRQGNLGKYELRKEIAGLWDELGPGLLTARATAKGIATPNGQTAATPQQPAQRPALSPQADARAAKLALAANAPPDLSSMSNAGGANAGAHTDSQIEAMSEDEIGNLPDAVRRKLLGMTA